jgi:hypothetical protein
MTRTALILLHAFIATGAIPAGILYVVDPSTGGPLDSDPAWLDGSPFADFLVPGLFLALVIGAGNLAAVAGQARQQGYAAYASMACGVVLATWIVVQASIVPFNPGFHPAFLLIGLAMVALGYAQLQRQSSPEGKMRART